MRVSVDDPDDKRIEVFQGLRDHVLRRKREEIGGDMAGFFVAEGDLVVDRALRAGYQLHSILIDGKRAKALPPVIGEDIPVYAAAPQVLQHITGYHLHRGMLACFYRRPLLPFAEVVSGSVTAAIIEGVNNPTNLGVILRCAAALGADAFFLDPTCCDPLYRRAGRVSMGEAFALPYAYLDPFPGGLRPLSTTGMRLLALTPSPDADDISELRLDADEPVGLLLGA
ncbi:MAG: RNA methyltransferase, partial [Actinomycetia bacterium]|nr:RNA methyltransferase [Actinomycetes bacterium]